jgi:hypothetical protein
MLTLVIGVTVGAMLAIAAVRGRLYRGAYFAAAVLGGMVAFFAWQVSAADMNSSSSDALLSSAIVLELAGDYIAPTAWGLFFGGLLGGALYRPARGRT